MLAQLISWLTPGTFFLLINVVIGTIFLITRFTAVRNPKPGPEYKSQPQRERKPSLLDPVIRSINLNHYNFLDNNFNRYKSTPSYPESDHPNPDDAPQPAFWLPTRTRSILERVKSVDFPLFHRSESMKANPDSEFPSEPVSDLTAESGHVNRTRSESAVVQPRIPEMVKKSASEKWEEEDEEEEFLSEPESDPIREPGHVNRSRSEGAGIQRRIPEMVKKSASEKWEEEDEEEEFLSEPESDPIREPGHVNRSRSEGAEIQRRIPEMIKRSASENWDHEEAEEVERNRPATCPATSRTVERGVDLQAGEENGGGDVDLEADHFIDKFRQQLKLQRLKSLVRYRDMLMGT